MADEVKVPGKAWDIDGDDLLPPIKRYLVGLHLLRADGVTATDDETPEAAQVISTGAFSLSKYESRVAKWFAGIGGVAVLGGVGTWWNGAHELTQAALVIGGCGIIVAAVLAIAIIVRADVTARATASAARFHARAAIGDRFIEAYRPCLRRISSRRLKGDSGTEITFRRMLRDC